MRLQPGLSALQARHDRAQVHAGAQAFKPGLTRRCRRRVLGVPLLGLLGQPCLAAQ